MPNKRIEFLQEIRKFTEIELVSKHKELKTKLHKLSMSHALTPSENSAQFNYIRKDIARILTELRKRKHDKSEKILTNNK